MTLSWLGWFLPLLEIGAAMRLFSRIYYKRCPVLMVFLLLECLSHSANLTARMWGVHAWVITWSFWEPMRLFVRLLVVCEVLWFGCVRMKTPERIRVGFSIVGLSVVCGMMMGACGMSPLQSFTMFRQFYSLTLAIIVMIFTYHLWREPIMENSDHRHYRLAMTCNMALWAMAGTFVNGGFGYLLFPWSKNTWLVVDRIQYVGLMLTVIWLAWGMTSNISCFRLDVADKIRKKKAKEQGIEFHPTWG